MIDLATLPVIEEKRIKRLFRDMFKLWLSVPKVKCKGLCQRECGNVPLLPVEALYLEKKYEITLPVVVHGDKFLFKTLGDRVPCPFLSEWSQRGQCTIYNDRPMICRAYGHDIHDLRCQYGCEAERPLLSKFFLTLQRSLKKLTEKCGDSSPNAR